MTTLFLVLSIFGATKVCVVWCVDECCCCCCRCFVDDASLPQDGCFGAANIFCGGVPLAWADDVMGFGFVDEGFGAESFSCCWSCCVRRSYCLGTLGFFRWPRCTSLFRRCWRWEVESVCIFVAPLLSVVPLLLLGGIFFLVVRITIRVAFKPSSWTWTVSLSWISSEVLFSFSSSKDVDADEEEQRIWTAEDARLDLLSAPGSGDVVKDLNTFWYECETALPDFPVAIERRDRWCVEKFESGEAPLEWRLLLWINTLLVPQLLFRASLI